MHGKILKDELVQVEEKTEEISSTKESRFSVRRVEKMLADATGNGEKMLTKWAVKTIHDNQSLLPSISHWFSQ